MMARMTQSMIVQIQSFFFWQRFTPPVTGAGVQVSVMNDPSEFHDPLISGHHAGEPLLLGDEDRMVEISSADGAGMVGE